MSQNDSQIQPPSQPKTSSRQGLGTTNATRPTLEQPKVDQLALNFGSQSAGTTTDASSSSHFYTSQSPSAQNENANANVDDQDSIYTYRSDLDASRFLRQVSGRVYNTINDAWFFPAGKSINSFAFSGAPEAQLCEQMRVNGTDFGGLYPVPDTVNAILAPQTDERKRILDLGAGTGIWAVDMAKNFPHAEVIGVDIVPVPIDSESLPPNCQFEMDDIEAGLSHFRNQFDLVHARGFGLGLKHSRQSMRHVYNCLKPGGLVIWTEPDYFHLTADMYVHQPIASETNPTGSWTSRLIYEIIRAAIQVGRTDFAGMEQGLDEGLWEEPLFDPDTCRTASLYLPIGSWANHSDPSLSQRLKFIGALARRYMIDGLEGSREVLIKSGLPADTVFEWVRLACEEMSSTKIPCQMRYKFAWGRRRAAPGQPAPPLPPLSSPLTTNSTEAAGTQDNQETTGGPFLFMAPYPFFYIWHTQEEALAEATRRNRGKEGFVPPPLPP